MKINIPFNQLLDLVSQLSYTQKQKLKKELETIEDNGKNPRLKKLILDGPVFTDEQIKAITESRKSINEWRKIEY